MNVQSINIQIDGWWIYSQVIYKYMDDEFTVK